MIIAAAQAASSITPGMVFDGLAVVGVTAGVWKYSLPGKDGKGTIPGRLVAIILILLMCWVLLAVTDRSTAMNLASGTATGVITDCHAITDIIRNA